MTLIVDAAPLLALANTLDPDHEPVRNILRSERGGLILPAPVSAEADYMLRSRLGDQAARAFLVDLSRELYRVERLSDHEYDSVLALNEKYSGLRLGLADASVVILASRFNTRRILTFDHRHFRAVEPLQGGSFTVLPADG